MGGRRESVPEVICFSFAKLVLAWKRVRLLMIKFSGDSTTIWTGRRVQGLRKLTMMPCEEDVYQEEGLGFKKVDDVGMRRMLTHVG